MARITCLMLATLALCAGCGISPIQKVNDAEKVFAKANETFAYSIRAGLVTDMNQIKATQAMIHEMDKSLDTAKGLALAHKNAEFNRMWPSVQEDLDRLLVEVGNVKPTTRETSWESSKSSPCLVLSPRSAVFLLKLLQPFRLAVS
jgi:hypothetical protein